MPLGRCRDYGDARYAGVEIETTDLERDLGAALDGGFDFVVAPLSLPPDKAGPWPAGSGSVPRPPVVTADFVLSSSAWSSQVVGHVSSWIQPDTEDAELRAKSEQALRTELSWAAHMSFQAVMVPVPSGVCANYARTVSAALPSLQNAAVWLRVPLVCEDPEAGAADAKTGHEDNAAAPTHRPDSWEWFHAFRTMCEHSATLGAVLDVGRTLPPAQHWRRWLGEPLKAVIIHTSAFLSNKRGFPVLPKAHQDLVAELCAHSIQLILAGPLLHQAAAAEAARASGAGEPGNGGEGGGAGGDGGVRRHHHLTVYWEYLAYLYSRMPAMGDHQRLEASYRDYLQAPLQPLADNLESQVYEVFEKDGTKYSQYEHAVAAALRHVVATRGEGRGKVVLMVVGAGRGPLVKAALRACDTVGLSAPEGYCIYAVEKNPNAMVHLSALWHSLPQWQAAVQLVGHDMRTWEAPAAADIMVSELLGSFGDNELSPECLDGAQRFLAPGGISIPQSYTSYLAPVTAAKLWNDICSHKDVAHLETPYVVNLHRCAPLADTQECFTFVHPNLEVHVDNSRTARLHFSRPADAPGALCHGFAGYFHSVLYGDVTLSIHPEKHTPNMFSWFPIFFPLRAPVPLPPGSGVTVHMWRRGSATKVWYEWALGSPAPGAVHNLNGRSYHVGL